jgi:hypothetical protein
MGVVKAHRRSRSRPEVFKGESSVKITFSKQKSENQQRI